MASVRQRVQVMPGFNWYLQRLRAMPLEEIPWRAWRISRARLGAWQRWPKACSVDSRKVWSGPCTVDELRRMKTGLPRNPDASDLAMWPTAWQESCLSEAEALLQHRFRFFMLQDGIFGKQLDWQRDYASGKQSALSYAGTLDYRDAERVGDVKVVWELSRMQYLTRLAQAWRWSGDARFAEEVVSQITHWIEGNPWMMGINWVSPMECSLRVLSWTWAFHLIRDWEGLSDHFCRLLVVSIDQHLRVIDSTYSLYSSANNHLIAEASGVYVAASYWRGLRRAERWRCRARAYLVRECMRQNSRDGVNEEHSFPYQFFVWELLVLPLLVGRAMGEDFPAEYWSRLEKMAEFIAWVSDSGGNTPKMGDQDDGKALDLGGDAEHSADSLLALASVLFKRDDFRGWAGAFPEERAAWLTGVVSLPSVAAVSLRASRSFREGGYHVLRSGTSASDEVFLLFDVAPNGDAVTAAHGHADALSVILNLGGREFLSDPGTFSYQDAPLRHFFRATAQHNTLCFCGDDQSEYVNRFMWGRRASVRLLDSRLDSTGGTVAGRVEWWTGAVHDRRVEYDSAAASVNLVDSWRGERPAKLNFTLAPGIEVHAEGERAYRLVGEKATVRVECDSGEFAVQEMAFSRRCYQKEATRRLVVSLPGTQGRVRTTLRWHWHV